MKRIFSTHTAVIAANYIANDKNLFPPKINQCKKNCWSAVIGNAFLLAISNSPCIKYFSCVTSCGQEILQNDYVESVASMCCSIMIGNRTVSQPM